MVYDGPLRDEPLAVELHNTIYATKGGRVDGLADSARARAWLEGIGPGASSSAGRLPAGAWPSAEQLVALRDVVRRALQAAAAGHRPARADVEAINAASCRAPRAPIAVWQPNAPPSRGTDCGDASRADVVLAAFAADAIELLTGPCRDELRTCGAPGCVLMFLKDHPRREWCSDSCGNRARQARHYERHNRPRTQT
jgi:predicted RNA-binding Zn ribbon-like protein